MPYELTTTIGKNNPVKFIARDWTLPAGLTTLRPYCIEFRVTFMCEYLDGNGRICEVDSLVQLTNAVQACLWGKTLVAEDDPWKDEICAMEGLGVLSSLVLPSTQLTGLCLLVKVEAERFLFEAEQNGRVWVDRVEARGDGFFAAYQRH
jgi:hypothetical protein